MATQTWKNGFIQHEMVVHGQIQVYQQLRHKYADQLVSLTRLYKAFCSSLSRNNRNLNIFTFFSSNRITIFFLSVTPIFVHATTEIDATVVKVHTPLKAWRSPPEIQHTVTLWATGGGGLGLLSVRAIIRDVPAHQPSPPHQMSGSKNALSSWRCIKMSDQALAWYHWARTCWHQEVLPVARKGQCRQRLWLLLTGLSSRSTETGAYRSWHDLSCRFCKGVPRRHLAHSRKPPCRHIWGLEVLSHFQFHTKTAAADQLTKHWLLTRNRRPQVMWWKWTGSTESAKPHVNRHDWTWGFSCGHTLTATLLGTLFSLPLNTNMWSAYHTMHLGK